eukprot:scaffold379583_cov23-Prasinocladus_malaysianus.AAC.1
MKQMFAISSSSFGIVVLEGQDDIQQVEPTIEGTDFTPAPLDTAGSTAEIVECNLRPPRDDMECQTLLDSNDTYDSVQR